MRFGVVRFAVLVLVCLLPLSCSKRRRQQSCRMNSEYVIAVTDGTPSAIGLAKVDQERLIVAWSADGNTQYTFLDSKGIVASPVRSVVEAKESPPSEIVNAKTFWPKGQRRSMEATDLALAVLGDQRIAIAILAKPRDGASGGIYLALASTDPSVKTQLIELGVAGEFAGHIAVAEVGDRIVVAWQEEVVAWQEEVVAWQEENGDHSRISLVSVDLKQMAIGQRRSFETDQSLYSPALATNKEGSILVWSQVYGGMNPKGSRLKAASITGDLSLKEARTISTCSVLDAQASLAVVDNRFAVAFRDNRDEDRMLEFYHSMLLSDGTPLKPPKRISRADGPKGPQISAGNGLVFSAQIRSYQRNLLVGFNRFDYEGVKKGGEFQVYADKSDFVRADLAVHGSDVILIYVEESDKGGRVISAKIGCK